MFERYEIDQSAYHRQVRSGPCFICRIVAGDPHYAHHPVYSDANSIAFLNKYPTLYGYTLVAPRDHLEHVTGDFNADAYLNLQQTLYVVAEAVRLETDAERVYLLSLGSQQGNAHVHWHVAPLPPGVRYEEQQLAAVSWDKGVLKLTEEEQAALAARLRRRVEQLKQIAAGCC